MSKHNLTSKTHSDANKRDTFLAQIFAAGELRRKKHSTKSAIWNIGIMVSIVALVVSLITGISFTSDVTDNKNLWGGYDVDSKYTLDRPVFIIKTDQITGGRLVLVPEESFSRCLGRFWSAPDSIDEYRADPVQAAIKQYDGFEVKIDVVGVLEMGTNLELHKLEKKSAWSLWFGRTTTIKPLAKVIDGPFQGKIVDLSDVSIYYRGKEREKPFLYKPEKGVIRNISEPGQQDVATNKCSSQSVQEDK